MTRLMERPLLPWLALALGACAWTTDPTSIRRPATIARYDADTAALVASDQVPVNAITVAHFKTYGGCLISRAENQLTQQGLLADIRSFQRVYTPQGDGQCTDELRIESNDITVSFTSVGRAMIRVFGQTMDGTPIVLRRDVTVVP
jgi:hypothetical protein